MRGVRPLALAAWLIFMPALRYHDWPDRLTQLNAPTSSARCRAIGLPVQPQTDLLNPTILDVGDHPGQALPFGLITYIRVAAKLLDEKFRQGHACHVIGRIKTIEAADLAQLGGALQNEVPEELAVVKVSLRRGDAEQPGQCRQIPGMADDAQYVVQLQSCAARRVQQLAAAKHGGDAGIPGHLQIT